MQEITQKESQRSQWRIKWRFAMTCIEVAGPPELNLEENSEMQTE